jgi:hypothetical protein
MLAAMGGTSNMKQLKQLIPTTVKRQPWLRRLVYRPFREDQTHELVVHCSYHKVGTVWFKRILHAVARHHGLNFEVVGPDSAPSPLTDIFLQRKSKIDLGNLPSYRGSHIVRDPRDIVVSAYKYHLWTSEALVHEPRTEFGERSYQQELLRLNESDGLALEIERCAPQFADMSQWDYTNPNISEVRFEDVRSDEQSEFARIFRHYGFTEEVVARSLSFVEYFSFNKSKQRQEARGHTGPSHLRSAIPGEWEEVLEPRHKDRIKELCGEFLIHRGYEADLNW